jgi:hypothetical protein
MPPSNSENRIRGCWSKPFGLQGRKSGCGQVRCTGHAIAKKDLGTPKGVPSFIPEWRALEDSNL